MITYYPVARTEFKPHSIYHNKIWTYDPVESAEKAWETFFVWANCYQYRIVHAYVDVFQNGEKIDTIDFWKDEDAVRRLDEAEQREQAELERQIAELEASMSPHVSSSTPSKDRCDVTSDGVANGKGE